MPFARATSSRHVESAARRFAISDGAPVEVLESGPSVAARLATLASRLTIRPMLSVGSHVPNLPWPWGLIDLAAAGLLPVSATVRDTVNLPNASAQLVRAPGVLPADGTRRVVLYLHGGAFLTCGANSHGRLVEALSKFADSPVLVVNYRLLPKHSVGMALDDCYDAYQWLRLHGYRPTRSCWPATPPAAISRWRWRSACRRRARSRAALVAISPLLQLAKECKQAHPNIKTDAMFPPQGLRRARRPRCQRGRKNIVDGKPEEIYEPLDHIKPGLPRTLIHVSGSEVLLHDARLAASRLAAAGVPVEVRVWPGPGARLPARRAAGAGGERSLRQIGDYIREATG